MENFSLHHGILNVYDNLNQKDIDMILSEKEVNLIQFAGKFPITETFFRNVNDVLLVNFPMANMRIILNGEGPVSSLDFLEFLPNLKCLTVDFFNQKNDLAKINAYLDLKILGLLGSKVSLKAIAQQKNLTELFLADNVQEIQNIVQLPKLESISFSRTKLKNLEFLKNCKTLKNIAFILGKALDLTPLLTLPVLEKLSFLRVKDLTEEHLKPIRAIPSLKILELHTQNKIKNLDFLKETTITVNSFNCKNI